MSSWPRAFPALGGTRAGSQCRDRHVHRHIRHDHFLRGAKRNLSSAYWVRPMKLELHGDNERGQAGTHDRCGSAGRRRCCRRLRLRLGKIRFIISVEDKMLREGQPWLGMNADHCHLTRHPGGHVTGWGPVPTPALEQLWRFCSLHIVCPGPEARPNSPLSRLPWCSSPSPFQLERGTPVSGALGPKALVPQPARGTQEVRS